jgi:hypothetical protein
MRVMDTLNAGALKAPGKRRNRRNRRFLKILAIYIFSFIFSRL